MTFRDLESLSSLEEALHKALVVRPLPLVHQDVCGEINQAVDDKVYPAVASAIKYTVRVETLSRINGKTRLYSTPTLRVRE